MTAAQSDDPIPVLEISFINTLNVFRALWFFTALFKDIPLQDIFPQLVSRALDSLAHQPSRPRRHRSCPRAVRQPIALGLACSETHRPLESFSMKSAANQPELPKGIGAKLLRQAYPLVERASEMRALRPKSYNCVMVDTHNPASILLLNERKTREIAALPDRRSQLKKFMELQQTLRSAVIPQGRFGSIPDANGKATGIRTRKKRAWFVRFALVITLPLTILVILHIMSLNMQMGNQYEGHILFQISAIISGSAKI